MGRATRYRGRTCTREGVATGLDFDDAPYLKELLNGMSSSPEVLYAVVYRSNGTILAGYSPMSPPPAPVTATNDDVLAYTKDQLRVDAPVRGKGGATGTLRIGFRLGDLESEVAAHRAVVALISALIFGIGLIPSSMIASVLVRPLQEMTAISSDITKGDLSQKELKVGCLR